MPHEQRVVPALRITNYVKSKTFYVDGLAFKTMASIVLGWASLSL